MKHALMAGTVALAVMLAGGLTACGSSGSNTPTTPAPTTAHLTWSAAKIVSEVMAACGPSAAGSVSKVVVTGTPSDNGSTETANLEITQYGYQTTATTFTLIDKTGNFTIGGVSCQPPP